jgi:outer membrane protein OmpA-like peptidoglycan-associated protein
MRKFLYFLTLSAALLMISFEVPAQKILKTIENRAKAKAAQRVIQKADKAVDKALDEAEEDLKPKKEGEETSETKEKESTGTKPKSTGDATSTLSYNSKYDFVPGEKVIAFEDFSKTENGDMPERWNTNVTAEVVTINTRDGKWLKMSKEGTFHPEFITNLPDNFTLEFDLAVNNNWNGTHFSVNLAKLKKPEDFTNYYHDVSWRGDFAVHMNLKPAIAGTGTTAVSRIVAGNNGNHVVNNDVGFRTWDNASKNFVHVSIWRQKQRLRVYANGEKIWDLPRAFDATSTFNAVTFALQGSYREADYFLLGNIRLAVGAADTRNKLITEGKFVTRGILFDVNSDKIKPESLGALKDIANILKENPEVKVKIVGHTDGDGDEKANMSLSQKRAAAVKAYLVKEFGIREDLLTSEGKGEGQPVDKNTTLEGKANNRRVEFIKQ